MSISDCTYYNSIAQGYNELHFDEQQRKARLIIYELQLRPTDTLLDVGCGSGSVSALFPCSVFGIDPSSALLAQATIPVQLGVAEHISFPAASFDYVLCLTACHHFSDLFLALFEMQRVCRRTIIISVLKKSPRFAELASAITSHLHPQKEIHDIHDVIYFCPR